MVLLAEFCTRLACGLSCMMLAVRPRSITSSYFRTLALVVLGLTVLAALQRSEGGQTSRMFLVGAAVLAFLASMVSASERTARAERPIALLLVAATAAALVGSRYESDVSWGLAPVLQLAATFASALLLGSVTSAMLLGHSYLVAPAMSIEPLNRAIALWAVSLVLRMLTAAASVAVVGHSTAGPAASGVLLGSPEWLAVRWGVGLVAPAGVAWMVWQTARLRSTQSATGLLYAGAFLVFFGEAIGMALTGPGGIPA